MQKKNAKAKIIQMQSTRRQTENIGQASKLQAGAQM